LNKQEILKTYFGHDSFRVFQEEAVDAILAKQDLLMILPTGGGKSLCYQLPTLLMNGVTLVISPLLALMHDQVSALKANNIQAAMISSMQSEDEIQKSMQNLLEKKTKLLYVAPERLVQPNFLTFLQQLDINFFVIDEAHCVSEWGHDFRADYRRLALLKEYFPTTPIAAFTATATELVKNDIINALHLQTPTLLQGVTFRDNLTIKTAYRHQNGEKQLLDFLQKYTHQSGIIYTLSRKDTEKIATMLQNRGINAKAYHAGLSTQEKNATFKDFINDDVQIVVATIAFGMGIDKSNIRFVVHMSMPKTIENYYQEIGRAGRDGEPSETLLLYAPSDIVKQRLHINENPNDAHRRLGYDKLQKMNRLASGERCRHQYIAEYFEDAIEPCQTLCDFCQSPEYEKEDITQEAQMFLSAILRSDSRFGAGHIIDILRGSKSQKIEQFNHQNLSVYGIGENHTKVFWQAINERLIELEAINIGEYSVLSLTPYGMKILKAKEPIDIKKERLHVKATQEHITLAESEEYMQLKELRYKLAKEQNLPPYVIFGDKTLHELALKRPLDKNAMLQINGIGDVKFEKYGEAFLELIATFIPIPQNASQVTQEEKQTHIKPKVPSKLSKTYAETLELIHNSLSFQEIVEHRGYTSATIINHINKLFESGEISQAVKEKYFLMAEESLQSIHKEQIELLQKSLDLNEFRNDLSLYLLLKV